MSRMKPHQGFIKIALVVIFVLCATVIGSSVLFRGAKENPLAIAGSAITFTVFQGEFVASVNEVGDIESSHNVEIRCQVRSRGGSGATILELIPEGTQVRKGDFLCQLDDSLLRDELIEQKINVAKDRASVIEAESVLNTAKSKLQEFQEGSYQQQLAEFNAAITVAKEAERRAADIRKYSETLNRKGYLTKTRLQADVFAEEKATLELKLAEERLNVFEKFTKGTMLAELEAAIRKQEADLEASQFTVQLSQQREAERTEQVANCRILAPAEGTLVYANESDRDDSSVVIEEGVLIRDGQPIFFLPDPSRMQVEAKINDSKISKVKVDQRVEIRVDTDPENPIAGRVKRVSRYPNPRRYYQAPIEYDVIIEVTELRPNIRSGLRAKVEIFVERIPAAIQAPISSLLKQDGNYFVIVKTEAGLAARPVEIGSNNYKFVVITAGLQPGEEVLVDADNYRDVVQLPST
jgi:HlyD family secretion protein